MVKSFSPFTIHRLPFTLLSYEFSNRDDAPRARLRRGEAVQPRHGHPDDAAADPAAARLHLHLRDEQGAGELLGGADRARGRLRAEALGGDELLRDPL